MRRGDVGVFLAQIILTLVSWRAAAIPEGNSAGVVGVVHGIVAKAGNLRLL